MAIMQVFYDYECPYCKRGYEYLEDLLKARPDIAKDIDIEWRPVEAHPRPEDHPPHTDLSCQAYYIAKELGANMPALHSALFQAVATERQNVEDPAVLTNIVKGLVDPVKFRAMLDSGNYAKQIEENNDLAYEKSGVWFVPAFRMISGPETGKKLDAAGGVGIFREQLNDYLGVK